jgi:hypothetical protein
MSPFISLTKIENHFADAVSKKYYPMKHLQTLLPVIMKEFIYNRYTLLEIQFEGQLHFSKSQEVYQHILHLKNIVCPNEIF